MFTFIYFSKLTKKKKINNLLFRKNWKDKYLYIFLIFMFLFFFFAGGGLVEETCRNLEHKLNVLKFNKISLF